MIQDQHQDLDTRIVALARTFPSLAEAPLEPWSPVKLDQWAVGPSGTHASRHAAAFVLAVWDAGSQAPVRRARDGLCRAVKARTDDCLDYLERLKEGATGHSRKVLVILEARLEVIRVAFRAGDDQAALAELDRARVGAALTADPALIQKFDELGRALGPEATVHVPEALRMLGGWRIGPFAVTDAIGGWNNEHREAFLAWARAPWWA